VSDPPPESRKAVPTRNGGGRSVPFVKRRRREKEEGLVGAVETVLWFPRSGGRVLCVHRSGSFHRLMRQDGGGGRSVENTRGRSRDGSARRGSVSRRRVRGATSRGESRQVSASTGPTTHDGWPTNHGG
jgi:hypothetical protein